MLRADCCLKFVKSMLGIRQTRLSTNKTSKSVLGKGGYGKGRWPAFNYPKIAG